MVDLANYTLAGLRGFLEQLDFFEEFRQVMLRDFVGAGRKLHFTDVDDVVDAVDQKVELCAVFPRIYPATWGTFYSRDSECVQDLRIMLKAQHFECVAAPTVVFRLSLDLQPLVAATLRPFREDDEKGCGVLGAEPLGVGVMEDLAGTLSPSASLQGPG